MIIADINQETRDLCDADTVSYPATTLLRRVNSALEECVGKIINIDGFWQFDDTNYTDLPTGTGTLVASQSSYSFAAEYLTILKVKAKDSSGNWHILTPIDQAEDADALEDRLTTDGLPTHYDKIGDSIKLFPAPSAASTTLTSGLKVEFQRTASIFTSAEVTTGTKVPGIASPYHMLLAYKAALPYCMSYKKDRVALYLNEINRLEKEMLDYYARRPRDEVKRISPAFQDNR